MQTPGNVEPAMFTFTLSTTEAGLVALLAETAANFMASKPVGVRAASPPGGDASRRWHPDDGLVRQIVSALTYMPLKPTQILALKTWYHAPDWVHVSMLQEQLVKGGLAANEKKSVSLMRSALGGLGIRMSQKVTDHDARDQKKLATFVDIRRADGSASYRLTDSGRKAVKIALKL
jgi:hypothetical protein